MFNIKKNISLAFIIVMAISCKNYGKLEEIGAPDWVFNPSSVAKNVNEVSAVGIGEQSKGGLKVQIAQAESDARGNIANQILSEVARISKDAIRKSTVADVEDVEKVFSQATQEIVRDLPLSGATKTHMWQDPKTNILYIRMAMEGKKVASHLNDSMEIYDKRLKRSGLGNQDSFKSDQLISTFNKEIDSNFNAKSSVSPIKIVE
jgi:hypothetical protein